MTGKKSKYLANTFFYTSIPAFRNFISFFTLPIMTRFLKPQDYGTVALITMLVNFGNFFIAGINSACYRYYFKYKDDPKSLKEMLSTNIFFLIASLCVYGIILISLFPLLNHFFFAGKLSVLWVILAFAQLILNNINNINQIIIQSKHEGKKWALNESVALIVQISTMLGLVISRQFTFEAIIIAMLAAESIKMILIFFQLNKLYSFTFKGHYLKESLIYSWPSWPTALISFGYTYIDRILTGKLSGLIQVGLLDMSSKISSILKMTMEGIGGVTSPIIMELLTDGSKESLKRIAELNLKIAFLLLFVSSGIIMATREIVLLLTTKEYYFVMFIAPLYCFYNIFGILGQLSNWLIYYRHNKTFLQIPLNIIFLVLSTVTNLIFIPKFGVIGAAFAIFISSLVCQVVQFIVGLKITPIPMNIPKMTFLFFLIFIETAIVYLLTYINAGIIWDILIKFLLLAGFIIAGLLIKAVKWKEIQEILYFFREKVISLMPKKS